ncbi:hypothetical protein FBU59_002047 [Linderina macrospora]|uniref:Uncharacterized protein n=1 Tax=Linderina macrospora TaxID=4868 RepID=A0ACC1JCF1_9FUNG|nr:hypothetical protein FBU59_002047 [Linderina macrospora]
MPIGGVLLPPSLPAEKSGKDLNVTLIVRNESADAARAKSSELPQFTVRGVDYTNGTGLIDALTRNDVVLSLLGGAGVDTSQISLAKAASKAGVKYFIPSVDLGYIYGVTGFFADFFLNMFYNWDLKNLTVAVPGEGSAKASFILRADIAKYTIAVLKRADELRDTTVKVIGDIHSFNDRATKIEGVSGKKVATTTESLQEIKTKIDADIKATGGWTILGDCQYGRHLSQQPGGSKGESKCDNDKFPDIVPASINEHIQPLLN